MAGLTWLHLSDWHQKGEDFDGDLVRQALLQDIQTRTSIHRDLEKIDFIVFSGDATFDGKKESYDAAVKYFFDPLLKITDLDPSRLFMVPGNHDLDREIATLFREQILLSLTSDKIIHDCLGKNAERKFLLKPFKAYETFAKPYAAGTLSPYASYSPFKQGNLRIALLGFNTALLCGRGDHDYGNLFIGEYPVTEFLEKAKTESDVRIAVLHHPFEYLTEADRNTVEQQLKKEVHFVLFGHTHKGNVVIHHSAQGDCLLVPAGASYNRRSGLDSNYTSSYNFVHLDLKNNKGVAYLRQWHEKESQWAKHIRESHPEGIFEFPLPKKDQQKFHS